MARCEIEGSTSESQVVATETFGEMVQVVNSIALTIYDIARAEEGEKEKLIEESGPSMMMVLTAANGRTREDMAPLLSSMARSGNLYEAVLAMCGYYEQKKARPLGFPTPDGVSENNADAQIGQKMEVGAMEVLSDSDDPAKYIQMTLKLLSTGGTERLAIFEQRCPVVIALLLAQGKDISNFMYTVIDIMRSDSFLTAMDKVAVSNHQSSAVSHFLLPRVKKLRSPIC